MKTVLTLEEINQIIDNAETHAKTVCDRTYEKATESIGKNDRFKEIIDNIFDNVCKSQINLMKLEMSTLFSTLEPNSSLALESIKDYTNKCIEQQSLKMAPPANGRGSGKTVIVATYTIVSACRTAFVEKLAEYLEVEV